MFSPVFCHLNTKTGPVRKTLDKGSWITFGLLTKDGRTRVFKVEDRLLRRATYKAYAQK